MTGSAASATLRLFWSGGSGTGETILSEAARERSDAASARPLTADDPDLGLVRRVAAGDQEACRVLVDRHLPRVLALGRRMLASQSDAEDVAQEVFIRVWRHAARWEPGGARFETWIHRVAINLCYDRLRRRREVTVEELPEVADEAADALTSIHQAQLGARVEAAIASLPERQKAAILLCHQQGLTNIEAAALLEISVEALESLLARGRRRLRELLADAAEMLGGP